MFDNDSVWKRSGSDAMSKNLFALMVSFWTAVGIGVSAVSGYYTMDMELNLWFILGAFVVSVVGILIALGSDNPLFSIVGYMLVAAPMGAIMGPAVAMYTTASVVKVFFVTTGVVSVLGVVGAVLPDSLDGWGSWLLGGLGILVIGSFAVPIAGFFGLPIEGALTVLDWAGVLIFSGYVIYDWNRAMRVPRTMDNAIDCALAVYLDFINLFLRLLSIMGTKSDSSRK